MMGKKREKTHIIMSLYNIVSISKTRFGVFRCPYIKDIFLLKKEIIQISFVNLGIVAK